jgi:hypothetical protein
LSAYLIFNKCLCALVTILSNSCRKVISDNKIPIRIDNTLCPPISSGSP